MNNYFQKIGNKELTIPIKPNKILNEYGITINQEFIGVRYYDVEPSVEKKLLKTFIYPSARKHFYLSLMVINNSYIPPHTDNMIKLVLNYYIETGDATTYFWKPKQENLSKFKVANQIDGKLYLPNELDCIESFTAEKYDLWMLNVSEIHSVGTPTSDNIKEFNPSPIKRIAFSFQTEQLTYDYVLKNKDKIFL